MFFDHQAETLDPEQRRRLQDERLRDLIGRLSRADPPYWRSKLAGVDAERFAGVDGLITLPFTTKDELREHYPFGMLAVPLRDCVRVHASSGTRGKPTIVAYTRSDIAVFAETNARSIACAGGVPDDVLHVSYGYGLFTGGLGLHYGGERLGATVVPASGGNAGFQVALMADLSANGLCATPSFAMLLAERAQAEGLMPRLRASMRYAICGAEPWSDAFRSKLEHAWGGIDACDIYGLSEVMGPGVATECAEGKSGLHVFDDHFLPEVIDPRTGDPLPDGEPGELVITTLTKQALPVIRYRTGDVTSIVRGPCACGRTHPRIARLSGRTDDMLVVRGVNVFPSEVEAALLEDPSLGAQYRILVDRRATLSELVVQAELAHWDLVPERERVAAETRGRLEERLRLRVQVQVQDPDSIPRSEVGKVRRVFELSDDPEGSPG